MKQTLTHDEVIALLKKLQGSKPLRAFAPEVGVSAGYLSGVYAGKYGIGEKLLGALNLQLVYKKVA